MFRITWWPLACAAPIVASVTLVAADASAQTKSDTLPLPPVVVEQSAVPAPAKPAKKKGTAKKSSPSAPVSAAPPPPSPSQGAAAAQLGIAAARSGSLTVPNTSEARAEIDQTPGGVELVPASAYKTSTPSATIKDALDYVPGVFVQPKWGDDSRLSIRGSGLSRNFHLRGVQLYMDGIPDQHCRRLRRFPGDRSDRLPLHRGVQRRQRAALRRQLAGRRHQLRDADGLRRRRLWRPRRRGQLRLPQDGRQLGRRCWPGRLFHHRHLAGGGRLSRSQLGREHARLHERRLSPVGGRRDALLCQRQLGAPAHPGHRDEEGGAHARRKPLRQATSLSTSSATSTRCALPTRRRCASRPERWSSSAPSASTGT